MPSEMRCVSWLILMIRTLTCWPIDSTSVGWLTRRQAMSVTCNRAVDAAEVDERAVIGDVLHGAVDHLTFGEVGDDLVALLGAALLEHGAARHDDIAAAAIHLEDLERLRDVHQRRDVANRANVDLAARQEGHGAVEVDGEAALDLVEDHAVDLLALLERLLELDPAFLSRRALSREMTASPSAFSIRSR